ncbi:MAG: hypothetical protein GEU79_11490 [Acidimicrobiia bacterium]|nr:hypothetical protein [Acidimicrobiia bacterium]
MTKDYRLPTNVIPSAYRIHLEPNLEAASFTGHVSIDVEADQPRREITLNAIELDLTTAKVSAGDDSQVAEISLDEELERATLTLSEPIEGAAVVDIDFTGVLNDQLKGFYLSTFTDVDGVEQNIATTQFESTDARRAFPCWDEPAFKATFQTTLVVPDDLMAITNTSEESRTNRDDGRVEIQFGETMKMSTYLVAFVVGPFEATDPIDVNGTPSRIVVPRGKLALTPYAEKVAEFCLDYLENYYDIPYPGGKVDHVAIPDFSFGAMENTGCITYREQALLLDEEKASQSEKERILDVVGHELAHQWFGNLVTMEWWEGIWLNEAFASFMEMKATNSARPDWKRWLSFAAIERPWAYHTDQLINTRPVEFEVLSPADAEEMFDALTYGKGSAVLRMIEQFIGEGAFRTGVGQYLRTHAYDNTVTRDLWNALDKATPQWPVGSIMDTWILQAGFPEVSVEATDTGVRLTQNRYLVIPQDDDTMWQIPMRIAGEVDGDTFDEAVLLTEKHTDVDMAGRPTWVNVNSGGDGFYRTSYDDALTQALGARLDELAPVERYVLASDTWAQVRSGATGVEVFLDLALEYGDETEPAVWGAVLGGLGAISHHLVSDEDRNRYSSYVTDLVSPLAERLGWEVGPDEDDLTRSLRGRILGALGVMGDHAPTQERAGEMVDRVLSGETGIDPELAQASLGIVAHRGKESDLDRLWIAFEEATDPQAKRRYQNAIGSFDNDEAVARALDGIADGTVKSQDSALVVMNLLGNRKSGPAAWQRLAERWDELVETMPSPLRPRIATATAALSHPKVAETIPSFLEALDWPNAVKTIPQAIETLQANVQLRERETDAVSEYLR